MKLLRGTRIFGGVPMSNRRKKSICSVYHFHMSKLYCEATVEERMILLFSAPASRDGNSLGI